MRVGLEALDDVQVSSEVREAVCRQVKARTAVFSGAADLRLRLRRTKGALLCVAIVGFAGGDLVTSTATSESPLDAVVDALDGLPARMERVHRTEARANDPSAADRHAAVRARLKMLLDRA